MISRIYKDYWQKTPPSISLSDSGQTWIFFNFVVVLDIYFLDNEDYDF